jgi:amino acid adenylation domain-containing protein
VIAREDIQDLYPLTPMQASMLAHALREHGSTAYFEQFAFRLAGPLDPALFARAWAVLFHRHPALRSAIVYERAKRPLQVVLKERTLPLRSVDLRVLDAAAQDKALASHSEADRRAGFDLERDVLMRITLFRLAEARWEVVWSMHHILLDGWSVGILQSEFLAAYAALAEDRIPDLPRAEPFSRFVAWLEARDSSAAHAFWQGRLAGYTQPAALARTPTGGAPLPSARRMTLDVAPLRALAAAAGTTLNVVVQAAWAILLARHNAVGDVVFGAVVSGRPAELPGVERIVGLFINTIPVRVRLAPDDTVASLLRRMHEEAGAAEPHHWAALAELQAATPLGRDLLDHALVFENYPLTPGPALAGLAIESVERFEQTEYRLVVVVSARDVLDVEILFDASQYSPPAVEDVLDAFRAALEGLMTAGGPGSVGCVSAGMRRRLEGLSGVAAAFPAEGSLHGLVAEQARRRPEAVAVRCEGAALTYAALLARAAAVAAALGPLSEEPVGLCLERSVDMVAALLGILQAGGAYVALDPEYPSERLAFMAGDAGLRAAVTTAALRGRLPPGLRPILLEELAPTAAHAVPRAAPALGGERLAYVSYTSGSTGRPKGVGVSHRAVLRLLIGSGFMRFGPEEVFLHAAPLAFDASTLEIWGALVHGGRIEVAPPGRLSLAALGRCIAAGGVSSLWLTAGLFQAMVDERLEELAGVRQLLAGGDVLPVAAARRVLEALPGTALINGYGPTESTTFACCHPVTAADAAAGVIPIGRPIGNTRCYVLDEALQLVPVGAVGELCLGGAGLARGYLGQAGLTAERFVPDPFATAPGERLYRTGDRARWRADGVVEFLGRLDEQVKLRGFRVEPGEVEAALAGLAGVRGAAVVAHREGGEARLVGYAVAPGSTAAALQAGLAERLPRHALPSAIVLLDALPLTANGKLDRAALRPPARPAAPGTPPAGALQQQIAAIWAEILHRPAIAATDNFFDLGGHSLNATQIMSRLHRTTGIEIPLRVIFDTPTVAGLADWIERNGTPGAETTTIRRQDRGSRRMVDAGGTA